MPASGFIFLAIYMALVFIRPQESISLFRGIPIVFFFQIIVIYYWLMGRKRFDLPQYKAILAFSLVILISTFMASLSLGFFQFKFFFLNVGLVFIILSNSLDSLKRQETIAFVYIIAALTMSLHGIDQTLDPERIGWSGTPMIFRPDKGNIWQTSYVGIFSDPNDSGMVLASSLPFVAYFFTKTNSKIMKLFYLAMTGTIGYGIYLCDSRGTLLSVIAITAMFLVIRFNAIKLILPALLVGPVLMSLMPSHLFGGDESSQERIYAWFQGWLMFKSHPLFGVGKGQFTEYHHKTAHNSWVLAFAETGILGFYAWISLLFTSLYHAYYYGYTAVKIRDYADKAKQEVLNLSKDETNFAKAVFYSLISAMTAAFFLSRTYTIVLFVICALATSLNQVQGPKSSLFQPKSVQSLMFLASIGFIIFINIIIRVKG